MERRFFKETFPNIDDIFIDGNNFKTFNEIFLRIFLGVFFQFKWYEAIEYFFDQCNKYEYEEGKNTDSKNDILQDQKEFWPFHFE